MFQQRHYEAVAKVFKQRQEAIDDREDNWGGPNTFSWGARSEWDQLQTTFCKMFKADNDRFDRVIFDQKCGREP